MQLLPTPWIYAFIFAFGACLASFLNVVIWRVPRGESIVSPPSHCPKCNAAIAWYLNIPILSWLALRGKCAACKNPISVRYPLVEFLGGVLFVAAYARFGVAAPFAWVWLALMLVGSFIDFDHKLLPDFVTVGGMIYGVLLSFGAALARHFGYEINLAPFGISPLFSLSGLAFGFGLLWLIRFLGSKAFKREAMGLGDVFLMGAVGALFGPLAVFIVLMLSSIFGSIVGVGLILAAKARLGKFVEIPYGPYICLGCLAWMFYGPELVQAYLHLLGF